MIPLTMRLLRSGVGTLMDARRYRVVLSLSVVVSASIGAPRVADAETCRGTLLEWSCGSGPGGGPDLSEPLVTDRPDFTESTVTVGLGGVQLEMGYTYTRDEASGGNTTEHPFPETLLRVGMLANWLELAR